MSDYDWKDEFKLWAWGGCAVARLINREEVIAGLEKVWNAFNCMEHELYADYVYDALELLKKDRVELASLQATLNLANGKLINMGYEPYINDDGTQALENIIKGMLELEEKEQ